MQRIRSPSHAVKVSKYSVYNILLLTILMESSNFEVSLLKSRLNVYPERPLEMIWRMKNPISVLGSFLTCWQSIGRSKTFHSFIMHSGRNHYHCKKNLSYSYHICYVTEFESPSNTLNVIAMQFT